MKDIYVFGYHSASYSLLTKELGDPVICETSWPLCSTSHVTGTKVGREYGFLSDWTSFELNYGGPVA